MLFMHKSTALRSSILCRDTREYMRSESHSALWLGDFFYLKYSKGVSKLFQKWYNIIKELIKERKQYENRRNKRDIRSLD